LIFPTLPSLTPLLGGTRLDEAYPAKTRGMGYRVAKIHDPIFNRFVWSTRLTQGQTDGR